MRQAILPVMQAVPDLPGTEIIQESTGHGPGGEFHERWQQAEAGIGDFEAIFVPWYWSDEYQRPVSSDFPLTDGEREYSRLHGLQAEQIVWRRAKIQELCDPRLFPVFERKWDQAKSQVREGGDVGLLRDVCDPSLKNGRIARCCWNRILVFSCGTKFSSAQSEIEA